MNALWGLHFDMRAPEWGAPRADLYRAAIEMSEWADARGCPTIVVSEHHGEDDGYLPSPLTMAAAIAARTTSAFISVMALVPTLRDPVATAEDALVVDQISNGRLVLGLVPGYVPEEFAMFGVDFDSRGAIFEAKAEALIAALTGEPFVWEGRTIRVTPGPVNPPRLPVLFGGGSKAAARRAARLGDGFIPTVDDEALLDAYRAECERLGRPVGIVGGPKGPLSLYVGHDPEKLRAIIEPHCLHEANAYGRWAEQNQQSPYRSTDAAGMWASGIYDVVDPEGAVELALSLPAGAQITLKPLIGGLDPVVGWEMLHVWVDDVLPALAAAEQP